MTLLEKAITIRPGSRLRTMEKPREEFELLIAWARQQVTGIQAGQALGMKSKTGNYHQQLSSRLTTAIRHGFIRIAINEETGE